MRAVGIRELKNRLSHYVGSRAPPIYVVDRLPGMPVQGTRPLAEATRVFERYAQARTIGRVYVAPERVADARKVLGL